MTYYECACGWPLRVVASIAIVAVIYIVVIYAVAFVYWLRAPKKQRDEARALLTATSNFPVSEIEGRPYFPLSSGSKLNHFDLVFRVRVTNRQTERRMNVTFGIVLRWDLGDPSSRIVGRESAARSIDKSLFTSVVRRGMAFERDLFPETLDIGPGKTVEGYLMVGYERSLLTEVTIMEDDLSFEAAHNHQFWLKAHDYISGEDLEMTLPGTWSSK